MRFVGFAAGILLAGEAGGALVRAPNSGQGAQSFGVRAAQIRDPDGVGIGSIQFPVGGARP